VSPIGSPKGGQTRGDPQGVSTKMCLPRGTQMGVPQGRSPKWGPTMVVPPGGPPRGVPLGGPPRGAPKGGPI
jgi:hypothetical protein